MTKEEILAMEAGRELDEWVADKVMNYSVAYDGSGICMVDWEEVGYGKVLRQFNPSESIIVAWEVVEKIKNDFPARNFQVKGGQQMGGYEATIIGHYSQEIVAVAFCNTAPLAICKAALLAVMDL
jgi:hypothetical protein